MMSNITYYQLTDIPSLDYSTLSYEFGNPCSFRHSLFETLLIP